MWKRRGWKCTKNKYMSQKPKRKVSRRSVQQLCVKQRPMGISGLLQKKLGAQQLRDVALASHEVFAASAFSSVQKAVPRATF